MNCIHSANERSASSLPSRTGIALSLSFEEDLNQFSSLTGGDS